MRLVLNDGDVLVLAQHQLWVRVVGLCLLVAAVGVAFVARSEQAVACDVTPTGPVCVVVERALARVKSTKRIAAADVRRIEVILDDSGEDDSYCVTIATEHETLEVGRCSGIRGRDLVELVAKLKSFYAGDNSSVRVELTDVGVLWFVIGLLGLVGLPLIVAPRISRATFDRKKGTLTVVRRSLFRSQHVEVTLKRISGVSVDESAGAEGDEEQLMVDLTDGTRLALNMPADRSVKKAREAIEAFLDASAPGYRD